MCQDADHVLEKVQHFPIRKTEKLDENTDQPEWFIVIRRIMQGDKEIKEYSNKETFK